MYLSFIYIYINPKNSSSATPVNTPPPSSSYVYIPLSLLDQKNNIENRGVCLKLLCLYGAFDCCHCVYLWWCTGLLLATQSGTSTGGFLWKGWASWVGSIYKNRRDWGGGFNVCLKILWVKSDNLADLAGGNDVDSVDSATVPSRPGPGMSFWDLPGVGVVVDQKYDSIHSL